MAKRQTGRIVRSLSGFYDVQLPGEIVSCRGRGVLRKQHITPLTGDMVEITQEHGKWFTRGAADITAIYHPAALLRDPTKKPDTFADLRTIRARIRQVCSRTY